LNGLNDWARTSNRICRILGLGEVFAWKFNFEDSLESRAAILLARADAAGNFAMRPRERRETKEQDLFRSRNALAFDRSSLMRWRQRMGEDKLKALLQGKPGGGDPDGRDEAVRSHPCCDRRHGGSRRR